MMRRPLEPLYSFTLPSIHDDTALDCRIYHPDTLNEVQSDNAAVERSWRVRGIVMAHPYAPMGGSYDDRVVGIVIDEFLKAGWIIGTFNFRGAQGSKGHTSWSGRPELEDYTSFAAFFMHYVYYLRPHPASNADFIPERSSASSQTSESEQSACGPAGQSPIVILGGYSYGSLILKHLPPVPTILQSFASPIAGSAHDEIIMRAHKLSDQSNLSWINLARRQEREKRLDKRGHEAKSSVTMGGEETSPDKRRTSRDIRRSVDGGLSVDFGNRLRSLSHRRRKEESPITSLEKKDHIPIMISDVRYLLISPLTPPISVLAAPGLGHRFWSRSKEASQDAAGKLATLAMYGDQDMFTSAKKLRDWCEHRTVCDPITVLGCGGYWSRSLLGGKWGRSEAESCAD